MMTTFPSNELNILMYMHCGLCLKELKEQQIEQSPRDYAQLEVGWTKIGLQVWCKRHECNVLHVDFEGQQHPADTTRALTEEEKDGRH